MGDAAPPDERPVQLLVLEVVVRALLPAGERPGAAVPAAEAAVARGPLDVEQPVLANDAEAAAAPAGAGVDVRVQLVALDVDREARLGDLDREVVRVAVGRRDERVLAVLVRAGAPAADARLREDEDLAGAIGADDVRGAQARVAPGRKPIGDDRGQRLPDELGRERGRLVVPARRCGRLRAEDRARRDDAARRAGRSRRCSAPTGS